MAAGFVMEHSPKFGRQLIRSVSIINLDMTLVSALVVEQDRYLLPDDPVFLANVNYVLSEIGLDKVFEFPDILIAALRHDQRTALRVID